MGNGFVNFCKFDDEADACGMWTASRRHRTQFLEISVDGRAEAGRLRAEQPSHPRCRVPLVVAMLI